MTRSHGARGRTLCTLLRVSLLLVLAASAVGLTRAQTVQLQQHVFEIGRQLRCPVCVAESVADSNAQIAEEMRQLIEKQIEAGKSDAEILAYFQQRYGDWIMLDPPKRGIHLLVWVLPVAAAVLGAITLAVLMRRWRANAEAPVEVAPDDVTRVRRALEEGEA